MFDILGYLGLAMIGLVILIFVGFMFGLRWWLNNEEITDRLLDEAYKNAERTEP